MDFKQQEIDAKTILENVDCMLPPTIIVDNTGEKHSLRKFCLKGNWGICNGDATKILVVAKFSCVSILVRSHLLIAGSTNTGWEVYSLLGEYLESLPPMSSEQAIVDLNERKFRQ